jgi:hypothetical protein
LQTERTPALGIEAGCCFIESVFLYKFLIIGEILGISVNIAWQDVVNAMKVYSRLARRDLLR